MNTQRTDESILRVVEAREQPLLAEAREKGSVAGLGGFDIEAELAAALGEEERALGDLIYGPPLSTPELVEGRIGELTGLREAYAHGREPGQISSVASTALAMVLLVIGGVLAGVALAWALGAILMLSAALCILNRQAAPTGARYLAGWARTCVVDHQLRQLRGVLWAERLRQAAVSERQRQRLAWLMSEYRIHRQLAETARRFDKPA